VYLFLELLDSSEAACLAERLVAKAAFVAVFAEGLVFELAGFAVGELAFAAGLAVFERLVAKAAFTTVFAESATAFIVVESSLAVAMETAAFFAASVRSCSRCGALGRFVGHHAEAGVVTADCHFGQDVENVLRKRVREFNGTELIEELDAADVAAVDVCFASDCTHDVARGHMVDAANA